LIPSQVESKLRRFHGYRDELNELKAAQMFCEILLGQALGPRPGPGNQWLSHTI